MKQLVKRNGRAMGMPGGLLIGLCVSLGITLIGAAILASMVDREYLPWENIGYGVLMVVIGAAAAGSWVSERKIKRQRLAVCALSGLVYWLALLAVTALFFGGQYEAVGVTLGLIVAGCGVTCLMGGRSRGGKRRKKPVGHR